MLSVKDAADKSTVRRSDADAGARRAAAAAAAGPMIRQ